MSIFTATSVGFAQKTDEFRRPNIEAAQRAIQERYLAWSATVRANGVSMAEFPDKITWPALSNGKLPGDFPKDCFYSEELIDEHTGEVNYDLLCFLVADLVNRTVSFLPDDQFADPDLADRINGRSQITLPPAVWPGSQVNPDNYIQFFETVCAHVRRHSHPLIELRSTDDSGEFDIGGVSRAGAGYSSDCVEAKTEALAELAAADEQLEEDLLLGRVDQVSFNGVTYDAVAATWRGRYGFDHSNFGALGGTAKLYYFARDYNKIVNGRASTVALTVGGAPVPEYEKHFLIQSYSLNSGGKSYSAEIGTIPISFASDCPSAIGAANAQTFGYIVHPLIVASPNFREQIGELYPDCKECKACSSGKCPPGGTSSARAGSITYTVPLGTSKDGSAGSMTIYSETADYLMATPFGLNISTSEGATILRDLTYDGIPRQVVVPQGLVDIKVDSPGKAYSIRFYDVANRGSIVSGFYQPAANTAYKTISVANPGLNARIITGKFNLLTSNYQISAPSHGLTPGSYYVLRVDADLGAMPAGFAIGRITRKDLYYIYVLNTSTLAFLYFTADGQAHLDGMKDAVSGQSLRFSSPFPFNDLTISETTEGQNRSIAYSFTNPAAGKGIATLTDVTAARSRTTKVEITYVDATHRNELTTESDGAANVITKTLRQFQVFPWNRASALSKSERQTLVAEVLDPDGAALTTTYSYYTDAVSDGPNYSRLKQVIQPHGTWERYSYDWDGRAITTFSAYGDASPTFSPSECQVTAQSSAGGVAIPDADGDGIQESVESALESIQGLEVSRSFQVTWSRIDNLGRQRSSAIRGLETGAVWDAPTNMRSDSWNFVTGPFSGKLAKSLDESGVLTVLSYTTNAATGEQTTTSVTGVAGSDGESVVEGTRTITVVNASGGLTDVTTSDVGTGIVLRREYTPSSYFDQFGRATRVYRLDGQYTQTVYEDCCGTVTTTSADGTIMIRQTDSSGHVQRVVTGGIAERYSEGFAAADPASLRGFTRSTFRKGRGSAAEILTKVETYDPAGKLIGTLDPRDGVNRLTRFIEGFDSAGRWTNRVVRPDGAETSTISFKDGSVSEELRDGVPYLRFAYGIENAVHDGKTFVARTHTEIRLGDDGSETEWTKTFTDSLGREFRVESPAAAGGVVNAAALTFHDSRGRVVRQVDEDGVQTLFDEDALGNTRVQAIDINQNGLIDWTGPDRIQCTRRLVLNVPSRGDVVRTTSDVWERDDDPSATSLSVVDASTSGLQSWATNAGHVTQTTTTYQGGGSVKSEILRPDSTRETVISQRGLMTSKAIEHPTAGTLQEIASELDDLDRIQKTTNQVTGRETSFVLNEDDSVLKIEDRESTGAAPQTTELRYDNVGRVTSRILADGSRTETRYFPNGAIKVVYGAATMPAEYTYDRQGRPKTLTTWKQFDDASGAGVAGAAVTQWFYDNRGRLREKLDNSGAGPNYTYSAAGRLLTRASARMGVDATSPIVTNYRYGPGGEDDLSIIAGDVTGIFYSNDPAGTHSVVTEYDRRGRPRHVIDASGSREVEYTGEQLDVERYVGTAGTPSPLDGYTIDREFDELERYGGIKVSQSGVPVYQLGYSYDPASRLDSVAFNNHTVTYAYNPAAAKRITMDYKRGGASYLSVDQNFDGLDRLVSRVSSTGSGIKSVTYTYDSLNRRTRLTDQTGAHIDYDYDDRSQLSSEAKTSNLGQADKDHAFSYVFDDIGNRKRTTVSGKAQTYEANLLNQYESLTIPRIVEFKGSAHADATVSVDGIPVANRIDRNFETELDFSSPLELTSAHWRDVAIKGVLNGSGVNGGNRIATENRSVFLLKSPIMFRHDADGNLIDDDQWIYTWDAENRLISMSTKAGFATVADPNATKRTRLDFTYDSGGRRVSKNVYAWNGVTSTWAASLSRTFVYDGWNLLFELDSVSNSPVASYAWGTDLGGDFQSSGGISGLLFSSVAGVVQSPLYDGSGTVIAQVESGTGASVDEPSRNAWGSAIPQAVNGTVGRSGFAYSTKYTDAETGLTYYGFRYLDSRTGRWLSRDPIEEDGGINLHGFVRNDPVGTVDALGQYGRDVHGYFTYFAVLAASGDVSAARTAGAYTWGPDTVKSTNAIDVIYTEFAQTYEVQVKQHALTGEPPQPLRELLLKDTRRLGADPAQFGRWSHIFQDSYAHVMVQRAISTWIANVFGAKKQYTRGDKLYKKGLGHFFSGTLPDKVSTSPSLFLEMANSYYSVLAERYGGSGMSPSEFGTYAAKIASIDDSKREEFIRFLVRRCGEERPGFEKHMGALNRLNLDADSHKYILRRGSSLREWRDLEDWIDFKNF